jgi:hypothetical protein
MPRVENVAPEAVEQLLRLPMEGERKRVFLYKADAVDSEGPNGEPMTTVTAVFRVLDNPIPAVLIGYSILTAIGGAAAWFTIDKLESFGESTFGKLLLIVSAAVGIFWILQQK